MERVEEKLRNLTIALKQYEIIDQVNMVILIEAVIIRLQYKWVSTETCAVRAGVSIQTP